MKLTIKVLIIIIPLLFLSACNHKPPPVTSTDFLQIARQADRVLKPNQIRSSMDQIDANHFLIYLMAGDKVSSQAVNYKLMRTSAMACSPERYAYQYAPIKNSIVLDQHQIKITKVAITCHS